MAPVLLPRDLILGWMGSTQGLQDCWLTCWNVGWEGWIFQLLHGDGRENCWRETGIITFRLKSGYMDL